MSALHLPAAILASTTGTTGATTSHDLFNPDASPSAGRDGPSSSSVAPTGSASPLGGSAGFQRERRLREYQERERQAVTILQQRRQEAMAYHNIAATDASIAAPLPVSGVAATLEVIRQERVKSALPPLLEVARGTIRGCRAIFEVLSPQTHSNLSLSSSEASWYPLRGIHPRKAEQWHRRTGPCPSTPPVTMSLPSM